MLERATFVTTTGTGPVAPRPPPPPPPPPAPFWAVVTGCPARQTAYPAMLATISRNTNQISPRFFGFPEPGGSPGCSGRYTAGAGSEVFPGVVILNGLLKESEYSYYDGFARPVKPPNPSARRPKWKSWNTRQSSYRSSSLASESSLSQRSRAGSPFRTALKS